MRFRHNAVRQSAFFAVRRITYKVSNESLQVDWENGTISSYPYIFLRDNCQCDKCYHGTAKQRLFESALSLSLDIKPESVWQSADAVNLVWDDGHNSCFPYQWLQDMKFPDTDADVKPKSNCGLEPKTWGGELNNAIPTYDYKSIMSKDADMLSWLETIASTGISLIENAPTSLDIYSDLCRKLFCPIRTTHYG